MVAIFYLAVAGLIGYLFGAISFGYLYVRATKGINILEYGSGRTGGTNSLRAAGWQIGTLVSLSDVAKGYFAVVVTRLILGEPAGSNLLPWLLGTAGAMSVVGHNWSIFLGWRGGAGTGPNIGWATALWWPTFPIGAAVMIGSLLTIGMASVASLAIAFFIPITFTILYLAGAEPFSGTIAYMTCGLIAALIVTWALRPNIKRLLQGEERIVGPRARRRERRIKNAEG